MKRGNVLVVGNSGVGKSTLINAVIGTEVAETGSGFSGTTKEIKLYDDERIPFRILDTPGFEPSLFKEMRTTAQIRRWSKESAKEGQEDNQINVIWFCIEGTSRKLFEKTINNLAGAVRVWKSVPVIVVITKSYSVPERAENIRLAERAFASNKKLRDRVRCVLPVVAAPYVLNDSAFAPPEGITELIDATNELMPEGLKAGETDLADYKLNRRRNLSQAAVAAATATGVVVGAVPIPFTDAAILGPTEIAMVNGIARIYGIKNDSASKRFFNTIVEVGTVSTVAKAAISSIKMIPGINIAGSVLNAVVAGSIIAAMGEATIYAFDQIYLGNKSLDDIDWIRKFMESKLSGTLLKTIEKSVAALPDNAHKKQVVDAVLSAVKSLAGKKQG